MIIIARAYFNFLKPTEPCVLQISTSHSGHLHTTSSNPQLSFWGEEEPARPKSCSQLPCRNTSLCYTLNISCLLHILKADMVSSLTMVLFLMSVPGSCRAMHVFTIVLPDLSHPFSSSEVPVKNCLLWRSCRDMSGHLCLNVKEIQQNLFSQGDSLWAH